MKIVSPHRARERVMLYGGYGAGKTRAVLSIAAACPDSTFYITDTDNSYERMLDGPDFRHLNNVNIQVVQQSDFEAMAESLEENCKIAGRDDFVVFDFFDTTWDAVQEYWTDGIYGMEIDEYFMQVKKNRAKQTEEVDRGYVDVDWVTVKKIYARRIANPILNSKCHIIAVCGIKAVDAKRDDADIRRDYSTFRGKPAGNKDAPKWFHSVLLLEAKADGWVASTIKDREREKLEGDYIENFAKDYLVDIAGWTDQEPPVKKASVRRKSSE